MHYHICRISHVICVQEVRQKPDDLNTSSIIVIMYKISVPLSSSCNYWSSSPALGNSAFSVEQNSSLRILCDLFFEYVYAATTYLGR